MINQLKTEDILVGVRHMASSPGSPSSRFLALIENTMDRGSITKGRSPPWFLNKICRKNVYFSISANLANHGRWIPTGLSRKYLNSRPGTVLWSKKSSSNLEQLLPLHRPSLANSTFKSYALEVQEFSSFLEANEPQATSYKVTYRVMCHFGMNLYDLNPRRGCIQQFLNALF